MMTGLDLAVVHYAGVGPALKASAARSIGTPANTPVEIIDRLNREINAAFADPAMKARLLDTGGSAPPRLARRFRAIDGRGNGEVGQGDQGLQPQAVNSADRAT
jgi:hypothetical protein